MSGHKIFILTGASGTGKTTLDMYLKTLGMEKLVTHTTRLKRDNEIEGINYYYVDNKAFDELDKVEMTEYPKNSFTFYGLSKEEVDYKLSIHDSVYAVLDWNGVQKLRMIYKEAVKVIYITTTLEEIERRMRARGDSEINIQKRILQAIQADELNLHHLADCVIENVDIEESKKQLKTFISQTNN